MRQQANKVFVAIVNLPAVRPSAQQRIVDAAQKLGTEVWSVSWLAPCHFFSLCCLKAFPLFSRLTGLTCKLFSNAVTAERAWHLIQSHIRQRSRVPGCSSVAAQQG